VRIEKLGPGRCWVKITAAAKPLRNVGNYEQALFNPTPDATEVHENEGSFPTCNTPVALTCQNN